MYISAEGRLLPCMALSGMDKIQKNYPLIQEIGLAACLTDSRYMKFIETRASELLEHNSECKSCEYVNKCLCGCRASALENSDDILSVDKMVCHLFKNGWTEKIHKLMSEQIGIGK
jgi:radical SAM protein with 4Fe4S-binding SPASM domain